MYNEAYVKYCSLLPSFTKEIEYRLGGDCMNQVLLNMVKPVTIAALCLTGLVINSSTTGASDFGDKLTESEYDISSGVKYKNENYIKGSIRQSVSVLTLNLNDPYTKLNLNIPNPLNQLRTTEAQALDNHRYNNRVVGAMNASFFETGGSARGLPANLVIEDGNIIRFGRNSSDMTGFNYQSQAFGMMPNGKARIGEHNLTVSMSVGEETHTIFSIDDISRQGGEMVMFTPNHHLKTTGTSETEWAVEIVVDDVNTDMSTLKLGTELTGTVVKRNTYREPVNSTIPDNGFVLSANGSDWPDKLKGIEVGDEISVKMDVEDHWKQADYVLGSGPYLVKDGSRHITMNPSSGQATTRAPRTAIGISADGTKVFMVTADGRQPGFANGMTITELADYMILVGADRAINLDGGGSTTMVSQKQPFGLPTLTNRPSAGSQSPVSTTLQAIDTTPPPVISDNVVSLDDMKDASSWSSTTIQANAQLTTDYNAYEPARNGKKGLKLSYDFSVSNGETAAAYMKKNEPFLLHGDPIGIGAWVYGDGNGHWLRGYIYDGKGNRHTINFTGEGELDWTGWRYVKADLPKNLEKPLKFSEMYLVEPNRNKQGQGAIYFDGLDVLYGEHDVQRFTDLTSKHWAYEEVMKLTDRHVITGHMDGSFQPEGRITREQAATMLVRELGLSTANRPDTSFKDVSANRPLYHNIKTVVDEKILIGLSATEFQPSGYLTRGELATILVRAYQLDGTKDLIFTDVEKKHWAYEHIKTIVANDLSVGYPDGTFKPNSPVSRAEFSMFLDRVTK